MEELRPNKERAKVAIILIWAMVALEIILLISGYFQYELIQTVINGGEISEEAANANDTREQVLAIIYLIVHIVSAVTFIRWFRRAYYNLHVKVKFLSHTEGWAAGAWFVPIVCLYRPFQIMQELYKETTKYLSKKGVVMNEKITTSYLGIWWALWVISSLLGQFVFRYSLKAETIDEIFISTKFGMVANLMGIPLALITVKIIHDYSKLESVFAEIKEEEQTSTENSDIE